MNNVILEPLVPPYKGQVYCEHCATRLNNASSVSPQPDGSAFYINYHWCGHCGERYFAFEYKDPEQVKGKK